MMSFKRMFTKLITVILAALLIESCNNDASTNHKPTTTSEKRKTIDTLLLTDTTIRISGIKKSRYSGVDLNDSVAKTILYKYYRGQGYLSADDSLKTSGDKWSVEYKSIFPVDLNENDYHDAIVTFWLLPIHASGHCWQPHKAVIVDNDEGYMMNNLDFLPEEYVIDSVVTANSSMIIHGYEYDCGGRGILRRLRIRVNK